MALVCKVPDSKQQGGAVSTLWPPAWTWTHGSWALVKQDPAVQGRKLYIRPESHSRMSGSGVDMYTAHLV